MATTGRIEGIFDGMLRGWAWDPDRPDSRLDLLICVDGASIATQTASRYRGDLQRGGIGDGMHGFEVALPLALQDGQPHAIVLMLEHDHGARRFAEAYLAIPLRAHMLQGKLERVTDGNAVGWVWDRARPELPVQVELLVEGVVIGSGWANRFRNDLASASIGAGAHGFSLEVPATAPAGALSVQATGHFGQRELGSLRYAPAPPSQEQANLIPSARAKPALGNSNRVNAARPAAPRLSPPRFDVGQAIADARDAERRRDFTAAEKLLDSALLKAPRNFDLLFLRARVALALQDLVTSERCARAALDERPGHVRPSVLLARITTINGNHAEAIEFWARVSPGDDNYRERLIKRGRSLLTVGRPLEALGEFTAAGRLNPEDRDALLGIAEAAEASGSRVTALRRWRRFLAVAEQDPQATARIAALSAALEHPQGLASPLRNPTLRHWIAAIEGTAGAASVEPIEGLRLRSLASEAGHIAFAAAEPCQRRPGELPGYGLWLRAEGGGAEIRFALAPDAAPLLATGLCMGIELRRIADAGPDDAAGLPVELWLAPDEDLMDAPLDGPGWTPNRMAGRPLLRHLATTRPSLSRFDLRLDPFEILLLRQGRLALALRLATAGSLLAQPPRPLSMLAAAVPPAHGGAEDRAAAANLRTLGLLPALLVAIGSDP